MCERVRWLNTAKQRAAAAALGLGARVTFRSRSGAEVIGRITKVNVKTVKVLADSGVEWTVSPTLLKPEVKA